MEPVSKADGLPEWAWQEADEIETNILIHNESRGPRTERVARALVDAYERGRKTGYEGGWLARALDAEHEADRLRARVGELEAGLSEALRSLESWAASPLGRRWIAVNQIEQDPNGTNAAVDHARALLTEASDG